MLFERYPQQLGVSGSNNSISRNEWLYRILIEPMKLIMKNILKSTFTTRSCWRRCIFGNLNIPNTFVILKDDKRFPESARRKEKYNLGNIFHKIRNLDNYTRLRKEFLEMGIEFTFQPVKFEVFKEALLKSTKSCMEIVMFHKVMTQETIIIQSK